MFIATYVDLDFIISNGNSGITLETRRVKSYEYIHDNKIHMDRFVKLSDEEYYKIIEVLETKKFDGYKNPETNEYIDYIVICKKVRFENGTDYHSY